MAPLVLPDTREQQTFAILIAHYSSHEGFLRGVDQILSGMASIGHDPAMLLHDRYDLNGLIINPLAAASALADEETSHRGDRGFMAVRL